MDEIISRLGVTVGRKCKGSTGSIFVKKNTNEINPTGNHANGIFINTAQSKSNSNRIKILNVNRR